MVRHLCHERNEAGERKVDVLEALVGFADDHSELELDGFAELQEPAAGFLRQVID
jgi:hypothetical protein